MSKTVAGETEVPPAFLLQPQKLISLIKTKNPNPLPIGIKFGFLHCGGPGGIRTHDLSDANRTLSQLSYRPICYRYYSIFTFNCQQSVFYPCKKLLIKGRKISNFRHKSCRKSKFMVEFVEYLNRVGEYYANTKRS